MSKFETEKTLIYQYLITILEEDIELAKEMKTILTKGREIKNKYSSLSVTYNNLN